MGIKVTVDVRCPECEGIHTLLLDDRGRFDYPLPCDPDSGKRIKGEISRASWQETVNKIAESTVH